MHLHSWLIEPNHQNSAARDGLSSGWLLFPGVLGHRKKSRTLVAGWRAAAAGSVGGTKHTMTVITDEKRRKIEPEDI